MPPTTWIRSDAGLACRIGIGILFFSVSAAIDLRQNGRAATRWREYLFLLLTVLGALTYGAFNDQLTSRISWEYFYYGKELSSILGAQTPPEAGPLHWEAAKVGMKATWTAGLLIGVALLLANNPWRPKDSRPALPQLSYPLLCRQILLIFGTACCFAVLGGYAGWHGWLNWMSDDFSDMQRAGLFRPRHFMATYGIHLGGYVGGLIGTLTAVIVVRHQRRRLASRSSPTQAGVACAVKPG